MACSGYVSLNESCTRTVACLSASTSRARMILLIVTRWAPFPLYTTSTEASWFFEFHQSLLVVDHLGNGHALPQQVHCLAEIHVGEGLIYLELDGV